jgi:hypothetical protein
MSDRYDEVVEQIENVMGLVDWHNEVAAILREAFPESAPNYERTLPDGCTIDQALKDARELDDVRVITESLNELIEIADAECRFGAAEHGSTALDALARLAERAPKVAKDARELEYIYEAIGILEQRINGTTSDRLEIASKAREYVDSFRTRLAERAPTPSGEVLRYLDLIIERSKPKNEAWIHDWAVSARALLSSPPSPGAKPIDDEADWS